MHNVSKKRGVEMNVLEKILEEIDKIKGVIKAPIYENCFGDECGDNGDCMVCVCEKIMDIIRSHMGEATNTSRKRLIDANTLDDEVMNLFIAITGNPKQTTVIRECKESFRRIIDEQPTVYVNDGWIPISEGLPEDGTYLCTLDGELCGIDEAFTGMCGIENGKWDEEGCVIAWQPLPEPYKGE